MYFDASKRAEGAGAGVILISPQGDKMRYIFRMNFKNATNNEAEYEALIHGMRMPLPAAPITSQYTMTPTSSSSRR